MPDKSIPAVLLLADGTVAYGQAFGAIGTTTGEICFNTGMTGYQEVFTDPSYFGQILIMNSAHIGNYGVKDEDIESSGVKINGLIGRTTFNHAMQNILFHTIIHNSYSRGRPIITSQFVYFIR